MKKNEPLKGKILLWNETTGDIETTDGKYFLETKAENGEYVEILLKSDVKSAVLGLLEEINENIEEWKEIMNEEDEITQERIAARIDELEFCKDLIKKWFADVFEVKRKWTKIV